MLPPVCNDAPIPTKPVQMLITPFAKRDRFNRAIVVETNLLKVADYYQVQELLREVRTNLPKIGKLWLRRTSPQDFATTIEAVTDGLPHQEHVIWDQLLEWAVDHTPDLLQESSFCTALKKPQNDYLAELFLKGLVRLYDLMVIENDQHQRKHDIRPSYSSVVWARTHEMEGKAYEAVRTVERITGKKSTIKPRRTRGISVTNRKYKAAHRIVELDGPRKGEKQFHIPSQVFPGSKRAMCSR